MEKIQQIKNLFGQKEWFDSVDLVKNNIVIYTKYMNYDVLSSIPDFWEGTRVLTHFAVSKNATRDNYVDLHVMYKTLDIKKFKSDLSMLKAEFGLSLVETIFYEIHDGKNRLTNLSDKSPELKNKIQSLYDEYGFDVMYEEFE